MTRTTGIGLLVACSNLKAYPPPDHLKVSSLPAGDPGTRLQEWVDRLSGAEPQTPAIGLYSGVYWSEVKRVWARLKEVDNQAPLWIVSAGYGLLSERAGVSPYAATFTPGQADSIGDPLLSPRDASERWWKGLSGWEGPCPGHPRTIPQLLDASHPRLWVLVAGPHYVRALTAQLEEIVHHGLQERLLIISVGLKQEAHVSRLHSLVVPSDARWEHVLGKGRGSLSIRLAGRLLSLADCRPERMVEARDALAKEGRALPPLSLPRRKLASDNDVLAFIEQRRVLEPTISFTRLLRAFRDSQHACEYKRFRSLVNSLNAKD